ncbi:MAG: GNAT family N-acetyltransferase [Paracoccaceae bacterium]
MMIPKLETERLTLRGPAGQDVNAFVDFFTSQRSIHVGGPLTPRLAWRMFAAEIGHWHIMGCGMWTVTLKGDDTALGLVGCWHPADWPEREIGWLLWENAEGKGYALEAASAARDFAFGSLAWTTAVSYIEANNVRSIRLAERLGAKLDRNAKYPGDSNGLVYRHPRSLGIDGDGGVEAYS